MEILKTVRNYHQQTKHHTHQYAAALGYMDWATQPDPFRRYWEGSLVKLPRPEKDDTPPYDQL